MRERAERFGPYRLVRRIATGGMAEIFLAAIDRGDRFEKRVVLKRILPHLGGDPAFVQMFIDEAMMAGRLSHPNVVQVHDFGQVDGVYFIVMEHVDGADLRQLLDASRRRGRPPAFAEVAAIGEGVARGLGHAHGLADDRLGRLHIVHRDVTPHNVMVSRAGEVKVMDFGIAKAAARATRTATGMLKGKVAYMAPEQAGGREVDARCDQFSLGAVLWECLSGRRLFEGGSDAALLRRVIACDVRPLTEVRPEVPGELGALVMRCLAREPEERFADMGELERGLAAFRSSLGAAGAVRLGALVDELVPGGTTPARATLVLTDPRGSTEPLDPSAALARPPAMALQGGRGGGSTRPLASADATPPHGEPGARGDVTRPIVHPGAPDDATPSLERSSPIAMPRSGEPEGRGDITQPVTHLGTDDPTPSLTEAGTGRRVPGSVDADATAALVDARAWGDVRRPVVAVHPSPGARARAGSRPPGRAQAPDRPRRGWLVVALALALLVGAGWLLGRWALRSSPVETIAVRLEATGFLRVSAPPGLALTVDGRSVGTTPVPRLEVRAGRVRLGYASPAADIEGARDVDVQAGGEARVTIP